jgi:fatty aldehyde-generating acyl-ACP reductase
VTVPAPRPAPDEPSAPVPIAFLVHPRTAVAADLGRVFAPLGWLPSAVYERGFAHLPVPPSTIGSATVADRTVGRIVLVPLTPRQLLGRPELAARKVTAAVDRAAADGAGIVGLGALTAPATAGGELFRDRQDVGVTNGNAFTAAVTAESVLRAAAAAPRPGIALVGATGSVGSAVTRLLARAGVPELLLVGRTPASLDELALDAVASGSTSVRTSLDLADVRDCGLVVLLTSAAGALLGSEHLGPGTVVIDDTQPRNTAPALAEERPDVLLLDGGIVATPGVRRTGTNIGLPRDQSFACLAETLLLGLSGHRGHGTLGRPTLDQVDRLVQLSARFRHLGFALAAPTSFGRPVDRELWRADDPAFAALAASAGAALPASAGARDADPVAS